MARRATFVLLLCALPAVLGAQSRPAPEALARALQQRYQGIRDFSADFVHTYRGGVLRTQTTERGAVSIKKPGRMRWVYTTPEKKEFVSDGRQGTGPGRRRPRLYGRRGGDVGSRHSGAEAHPPPGGA